MKKSLGAAVAFCIAWLSPLAAVAAVRACKPIIVSGVHEAANEIAAKKLALQDWKDQAAKHGESHLSFPVAAFALLRCVNGAGGSYLCRACGAPCIIRQVAPKEWKGHRRIEPNPCLPFIEALPSLEILREQNSNSAPKRKE